MNNKSEVQFLYGMYMGAALKNAVESFDKITTRDFYTWKFEQNAISKCVKVVQDFEKSQQDEATKHKNAGLIHEKVSIDTTGAKFAKCSSSFTKVLLGGSIEDTSPVVKRKQTVNSVGTLVNAILSLDFGTNATFYSKLYRIVSNISNALTTIDLEADEKTLTDQQIEIEFVKIEESEVGEIEGNNDVMNIIAFLVAAGNEDIKEEGEKQNG